MNNPVHQVFISYSHRDSNFVNELASFLISCDLNVWKDTKDIAIGGNIPKTIYEGIKTSSHFCCIISRSSVSSAWVEEELSYAKVRQLGDRKLELVPLLIDDIEIPDFLKVYRCANLQNRTLSLENPEFLAVLTAFGLNVQTKMTHIITGPRREAMLDRCLALASVLDHLIERMEVYDRVWQVHNEPLRYYPASISTSYDYFSSAETKARKLASQIEAHRTVYEEAIEKKKADDERWEHESWLALRVATPGLIDALTSLREAGVGAGISLLSGVSGSQDAGEFELWKRLGWALYEIGDISSCILNHEYMGFNSAVGSLRYWTPRLTNGRATLNDVIGVLRSWATFDKKLG